MNIAVSSGNGDRVAIGGRESDGLATSSGAGASAAIQSGPGAGVEATSEAPGHWMQSMLTAVPARHSSSEFTLNLLAYS